MSADDPSADSIIREVPIDDLRPPGQDVRQHRDPDDLRNLAKSLEQNGQLVPANACLPAEALPDDEQFIEASDVAELFEEAEFVQITDGWSRKAAAEMLDWPTLRCEISRQPPEDEVVTQLAANTDRLDMGDYEVVKALKDYQQRADMTQADLAERVGFSEPYLSQLFKALAQPQPIVEQWANPESHIETGHVIEISRLPDLELKQRVFNAVFSHEQGVNTTRVKVENAMEEDAEQEAQEDAERNAMQRGMQEREDKRANDSATQSVHEDPCVFCGDPQAARIYIPVCEEDYHVVDQARESGVPLMSDPRSGTADARSSDE